MNEDANVFWGAIIIGLAININENEDVH